MNDRQPDNLDKSLRHGQAQALPQQLPLVSPQMPQPTPLQVPQTMLPITSPRFSPWVRFIQALQVIILPFWLISFSLMLLLLPPITRHWADVYVDDQTSSLSHSQLVAVADTGLRYISGEAVALPTGTDEQTSFTPDVVSHLDDVKGVITVAKVLVLALTLVILLSCIALRSMRLLSAFSWSLVIGGLVTLVLVIGLAVFGISNFDVLFIAMHEVLFPQGNWTFSASSLLICTYPEGFWMAMGASWAAILTVLLLVVLGLGLRGIRMTRWQTTGSVADGARQRSH